MFYKQKSINPLNYFNQATKTVRALSFMLSTILVTFIFTTPTFAAGVEAVKAKNIAYINASPQRMQSSIEEAIEIIKQLQDDAVMQEQKEKLSTTLKELLSKIQTEDSYAKERFVQMQEEVKGLSEVFQARVAKMQTEYESRKAKLMDAMESIIAEHTGNIFVKWYYGFFGNADAEDLNTTLYENTSQQKFDPNNMPFELRKAKPIKPKTNKAEFITAGLYNMPLPHYATLGDFDYSTLADASNPEYLAQSDEVNITEAIADKAAELDYDAVQIYNYVRNTIEFVPTWGAVQSAELTLGAKRGNAMDISSLLIALLRASKIPARYVHGTVDVNAQQLKNWAGGFESFTAAYNYASKGGIPIFRYPANAGRLTKVQMEHIWVEVATDYYPSRGAKNHKADSWIPLDASYKQYEYSEGVDMQSITGLDINTTVENFIHSGEVNEANGYAKGFDPAILQNTLNEAQTKIKTYIDTLDANSTTLYDVIGGKKIIEQHSSTLPNTLAFPIVVEGARYAKLPSSLQQSMTFTIKGKSQQSAIDDFLYGSKSLTLPMARLNNEKVTISFAPATQADEDALNRLLPKEEITDESQLPSSIPLYINVKPQLKVNGKVRYELKEGRLGDEYTIKQVLHTPQRTITFGQPRLLIAGGYYGVNTIVQSISIEKLKQLQAKIKQTQTKLSNKETTNLTREDIMGDMVYAASLSYYAQMIAQGKMALRPLKAHFELAGSSGIIGYKPKVNKLFGMPINLQSGGMNCDLIDTHMVEQGNLDDKKHVQANQQLGIIGSSLEHQVLEQLFATDTNAEGFSAVKAIQLANAQGQKIFTVTKENYQTIIPQLQLAPAAIADIRAAAQAGYTVTTHEKRIHINGYTGEGYIVLNERGTGAYMINGGLYGGVLSVLSIGNTIMLASIGYRNMLSKVLTGIKAIPVFGNVANVLILSSLILKAVDIALNCKAASYMVSSMMFMSAVILGLGAIIAHFINPLAAYVLSVGAISVLKNTIDTANCR